MNKSLEYPGSDNDVVTLTAKDSLWMIELHNGLDSRLTNRTITALQAALSAVEDLWLAKEKDRHGALIIVGNRKQDKFFSNGLDYENSRKDPLFFPDVYDPLIAQLLSFPLPIICAINGHCFAAAMILAMCCDYRVMTDGASRRAWMSMNEVHFGAPLPPSLCAVIRTKVIDPRTHRKIAMEGHRFTPSEALAAGLVDALAPGGTAGVIQHAELMAGKVASLAKTGVFGMIKAGVYVDILKTIDEFAESQRSQKARL